MSKQTEANRFILPPLSLRSAGFYQEILKGLGSYQQLGNRLIQLAEQAHAFRQFDKIDEVGHLLFNLPLKTYSAIGAYFLGVAFNKCGNGDQEKARAFFEIAISYAPDKYKGKAIMSLAALSAHKRDYASELYFFQESLKASNDLYTILKAHKGIAVIQAREGYHKHSLKYLESFLPLIRHAEPQVTLDYLNSYAVELGEAGRLYEARNISNLILASPLAFAYPEWRETAQELRPASRSFAAIEQSKIGRAKLLQMPEFERGESSQSYRSASVTNIQDWKADMGRKKKSDYDSRTYKDKSFEERDRRELLLTLVEIGTNKRMTDDKLYKVIVYMDKVLNEPDEPKEPEDDPGA